MYIFDVIEVFNYMNADNWLLNVSIPVRGWKNKLSFYLRTSVSSPTAPGQMFTSGCKAWPHDYKQILTTATVVTWLTQSTRLVFAAWHAKSGGRHHGDHRCVCECVSVYMFMRVCVCKSLCVCVCVSTVRVWVCWAVLSWYQKIPIFTTASGAARGSCRTAAVAAARSTCKRIAHL